MWNTSYVEHDTMNQVPVDTRGDEYFTGSGHHLKNSGSPFGTDPYYFGGNEVCGSNNMRGGSGFRPPVPLPRVLPMYHGDERRVMEERRVVEERPRGQHRERSSSMWERGFIFGAPRLNRILEEDDSFTPYDLKGTGTKMTGSPTGRYGPSREFVRSPPSENMHTYYPYNVDERDMMVRSGGGMGYEDEDMPVSPSLSVDSPYGRGGEEYGRDEYGRDDSPYGRGGDDGDRKRKYEDTDNLDIPNGFKLPASKSPIMEAMAYCAIMKWGIEILHCQDQTDDMTAKVIFRVLDFDLYYKYSCLICSKQNPTEDIGSRVKSLRRWFVNFPKKRDRRENPQFSLEVKPDVAKKVYEMVEKYKCQINVKKRRRTM